MNNNTPKPETYKGIYNIHKYWGKKPANVIRHLIEQHTKKGDVVLDPFSGSGVAPIEAVFTNRLGVGIDINPIAIQISREMVSQIDINAFKLEFQRIKSVTLPQVNNLYKTTTSDGEKIASHFVWNENNLAEVWFKEGRNTVQNKPKTEDIKLSQSVKYSDIPYFYPKNLLYSNSRINASKGQRVCDLFTPRNLMVLAKIFSEIQQIKNAPIKSAFEVVFTASIGQASKMVFVVNNRKGKRVKKQVGSWVIGYWVPKEHFEINPLTCFENRYNRVLKAKQILIKQPKIDISSELTKISKGKSQIFLANGSAEILLKKIPSESVDYIITDPPHGNRIPYLELSEVWNSWLKNKPEYKSEMVVSDSKEREKTEKDYFEIFEKVLLQSKRVMKSKAVFSLMFNTLDDFTWLELLRIVQKSGFSLREIETLSYSANSVVQDNRKYGLKNDFILHLGKANGKEKGVEIVDDKMEKNMITIEITKIRKGNPKFSDLEILNDVIVNLLKGNKICKLSTIVEQIKKG